MISLLLWVVELIPACYITVIAGGGIGIVGVITVIVGHIIAVFGW